ncbi:hypothetical protein KC19_9G022500 [Ceratodon purpureus]|uniref:t-SNARE coiled-coil homology domain-containing protein n=1 Tax=Ceratodon purpureus TaxID=3225 RepID=A0A8T0GMX1_CERPU|nr:hypothetical protein KC19_9G022500 [Ceratodon purpureus]
MSVIDILTRVDVLCKKYEKYDLDRQREEDAAVSGRDEFAKLYAAIEADIEATLQKAEEAKSEKDRATVATLNSGVRRSKAAIRAEIPKLQKLAVKKVKGITKEEQASRPDLVEELAARIDEISDGITGNLQNPMWGGKAGVSKPMEIRVDTMHPDDLMRPEHFEATEESTGFRQEFQARKTRQDQGLDVIAEGLATLKNMAGDINEELNKQAPLIDEADNKIEQAAADLKNTNVRLKDTVTKLRSNRNFCIDLILITIILGIAGYLYSVLRPQ